MTIRFSDSGESGFLGADSKTQEDARGVLQLLSSGFEITWFAASAPGRWMAAARPDAAVTARFGLASECIVIGNGRSVDFEQSTLAQLPPSEVLARTESSVRLLASADPGAEVACTAWAAAKRMSIVLLRGSLPTDASAVDAENELRRVLSHDLWRRDVFDESDPVRNRREFFGRDAILNEVLAKVIAGKPVALLGVRKVGKSSLLSRLEDVIEEDNGAINITAFVSGHAAKVKNGRWWSTAQDVLNVWQSKFQGIALRHGSKIHAVASHLQEAVRSKVSDTGRLTAAFEKDVLTLAKASEALRSEVGRGGSRLVLFVDGCDHLYPHIADAGHWRDDFFAFWNSMRIAKERLPNPGGLTYLVGGSNPSGVEQGSLRHQPNPLFDTQKVFLGPMTSRDTIAALQGLGERMGLLFEKDALQKAFDLVGGHPLLFRRLGTAIHLSERGRTGTLTVSSDAVVRAFKRNRREFYNQVRWILDYLAEVAPEEDRLLRDLALGGAAEYERAWGSVDLRETFAFNLERYGLVTFEGEVPVVTTPLVRDALQKPDTNEFADQKRQLRELVDGIERSVRGRLSLDISRATNANEAILAIIHAIPSDAKNRPLGRQELIDLGDAVGIEAVLESMNWGDYEILLNKFYDVIEWRGPESSKAERLSELKRLFVHAHLVRHNNDRELRELIRSEGFAALFVRFCRVRDMLAA